MNFHDGITLSEALIITAFSMLLVFAALIAISFILDGFKLIANRQKKADNGAKPVQAVSKVEKQTAKPVEEKPTSQEDDLELVAVITASIAAMLSRPANSIVVRNIVRIPQTTPVWGSVSRQEMINK